MLILETLHRVSSCSRITSPFIMLDDVEEKAFGCAEYVIIVSYFAPLAVHT